MWESDLRPDLWEDLGAVLKIGGFFLIVQAAFQSFCWWVLKETMARNGKLWTWIMSCRLNQNLVGHTLCSWNMHWSSPLMKWSIGRRNLWSGCKFMTMDHGSRFVIDWREYTPIHRVVGGGPQQTIDFRLFKIYQFTNQFLFGFPVFFC